MPNKNETPVTFEELARLINERKRFIEQSEIASTNISKLTGELEQERNKLTKANLSITSVEEKIREVGKAL